jgi:peptide/nickel transport system permease protein
MTAHQTPGGSDPGVAAAPAASRERRGAARHAPVRWALRLARLAVTLVVTFAALLGVTFFIGRKIPIDPVLAVVGDRASTQSYHAAWLALGLDKPLATQFAIYVRGVMHGELGMSLLTANPVLANIRRVIPATLELATLATLAWVLAGVPLGVAAAVNRNR